MIRMLSSPSLIPNCSSANSLSRGDIRLPDLASARRVRRGVHEAQDLAERRFHLAAIDHQVEHAAFEQELAALKAVRQLLPDGLFDDARPGKSDQRLGFG